MKFKARYDPLNFKNSRVPYVFAPLLPAAKLLPLCPQGVIEATKRKGWNGVAKYKGLSKENSQK